MTSWVFFFSPAGRERKRCEASVGVIVYGCCYVSAKRNYCVSILNVTDRKCHVML